MTMPFGHHITCAKICIFEKMTKTRKKRQWFYELTLFCLIGAFSTVIAPIKAQESLFKCPRGKLSIFLSAFIF
jgi:thermostable 8-oxoguanine DNA glycosylase